MDNEPAPDEQAGPAPSDPCTEHRVDALLGFFRAGVLVVVVVVGVVVWVVATALYGFILGRLVHSASIGEWYRWTMVVQQWSYAAWLGALAILAARWLRERLPR